MIALSAIAGLVTRLNAELPPDVRVRDVQIVGSDFAAMSNLWKRYVYTIPPTSSGSGGGGATAATSGEEGELSELIAWSRKVLQNSPEASFVTRLDLVEMQRAATVLQGTHDFASFQSKGGRITTVRTLHRCAIQPITRSMGSNQTISAGERGTLDDEELVGVKIVAEGDGFL